MLLEPIFTHARQRPDEVAFVDDTGSLTFGQFAARVAGLSGLIRSSTQNDKVGVLLPAGAAFAASFYATLLAGKTVVPINFLLGPQEIGHVLTDSGIDTVLTAPPLAAKTGSRSKLAGLTIIDISALPSKRRRGESRRLTDLKLPQPSAR